jgi:hypothetical protein
MHTYSFENLNEQMQPGRVYRRDMLLDFSKAVDRDLNALVKKGCVLKLAGGLYYKPAKSDFGILPPKDFDLVRCFLRDNDFLLYSWHYYNSLGVGLTQLYNRVVVLNYKRIGIFKFGNKEFEFRRPNHGFPSELTREYLLVDLVNNLNELAEDVSLVAQKIKNNLHQFDTKKVFLIAKKYGKVRTKHFFEELEKLYVSSPVN